MAYNGSFSTSYDLVISTPMPSHLIQTKARAASDLRGEPDPSVVRGENRRHHSDVKLFKQLTQQWGQGHRGSEWSHTTGRSEHCMTQHGKKASCDPAFPLLDTHLAGVRASRTQTETGQEAGKDAELRPLQSDRLTPRHSIRMVEQRTDVGMDKAPGPPSPVSSLGGATCGKPAFTQQVKECHISTRLFSGEAKDPLYSAHPETWLMWEWKSKVRNRKTTLR